MACSSATTVPAASAGGPDALAPALGPVEQLPGGSQGRSATRRSAEHLGELHDASLAVQPFDLRDGAAVAFALRDPELDVRVRRDLGQVGDTQDLVAACERPQAAPDRIRAAAPDPGVDLV